MVRKKGRQLEKQKRRTSNLNHTRSSSRFFTQVTLTESIQRDALGGTEADIRELVLRMRLKEWVSFKDAKRALLADIGEIFVAKAFDCSDTMGTLLPEGTHGEKQYVLYGTLREDFPQILLAMRKEKKLTQTTLANKIGVDPTTVGLWEKGYRKPRDSTLLKISEALGIPIKEFLHPIPNVPRTHGSEGAPGDKSDVEFEIIPAILREDFPKIIKRIRTGRKLTQKALAGMIDVDTTAVGLWERGARTPKVDNLMKLCQVLGLPLGVFYYSKVLPKVSGNES